MALPSCRLLPASGLLRPGQLGGGGPAGGCPAQGREHALGTALATRGTRALPEPGLLRHRGVGGARRRCPAHTSTDPRRMWAGQRSPFSASVSPAWASRVASVLSDGVGHPGRPRKGRGSFLYRNEFMGRVHVTPSPGTLESREGAQDLKGSPQAPGCLPKGGGCPPDGRLGSGPWEGTRPLSTVRSHSPGWGLRDGLGSVFRPGRGPLLLNGFPGGCWPTAWGRGLGAKRSLEATCQGASDFLGQAVS